MPSGKVPSEKEATDGERVHEGSFRFAYPATTGSRLDSQEQRIFALESMW